MGNSMKNHGICEKSEKIQMGKKDGKTNWDVQDGKMAIQWQSYWEKMLGNNNGKNEILMEKEY